VKLGLHQSYAEAEAISTSRERVLLPGLDTAGPPSPSCDQQAPLPPSALTVKVTSIPVKRAGEAYRK
jgi:hypothetical protein